MAKKAAPQTQASVNRLVNKLTGKLLKNQPQSTPAPKKTKPKAKRKPSRLPTLPPSPMAADFRHLKPSWRSYVDYVAIAARDGDKDMARYLACLSALSQKEQDAHTPETICDLANVKPADLFGAVSGQVWSASRREATMLIAVNHPRIIERTAKSALTPKGIKDREMFHKGTGFLPTPKGSVVNVHNSPQMMQVGGTGSSSTPLSLPTMEQDMMEIEDAEFTDIHLLTSGSPGSVDSTPESEQAA